MPRFENKKTLVTNEIVRIGSLELLNYFEE